jgi:hypothetical protein
MSIEDFSNPAMVFKRAKVMGIDDIKLSTRKDKKYMAYDGSKWVHFGQMGYSDYTKTKDKHKRDLFRKRNHKWADAPEMTPAFLAYYLLW